MIVNVAIEDSGVRRLFKQITAKRAELYQEWQDGIRDDYEDDGEDPDETSDEAPARSHHEDSESEENYVSEEESGVPEAPEVAAAAAVREAVEDAQVPEEDAQAPEASEHTEAPEASQHTEAPEATQHTEAPEATQHTEALEATQHTEAPEASEHTEAPEASKHTEAPEATQHTEAPLEALSSTQPAAIPASVPAPQALPAPGFHGSLPRMPTDQSYASEASEIQQAELRYLLEQIRSLELQCLFCLVVLDMCERFFVITCGMHLPMQAQASDQTPRREQA